MRKIGKKGWKGGFLPKRAFAERFAAVLKSFRDGLEPLRDGLEPLQNCVEPLRDGFAPFQNRLVTFRTGVVPLQTGVESFRDVRELLQIVVSGRSVVPWRIIAPKLQRGRNEKRRQMASTFSDAINAEGMKLECAKRQRRRAKT